MIFGKTDQEKHEMLQERRRVLQEGVKRFAWLPTEVADGRWVWLKEYTRVYLFHKIDNEFYAVFDVREFLATNIKIMLYK